VHDVHDLNANRGHAIGAGDVAEARTPEWLGCSCVPDYRAAAGGDL
jgi:hypothetical protein